jgi:hypothetical protein
VLGAGLVCGQGVMERRQAVVRRDQQRHEGGN